MTTERLPACTGRIMEPPKLRPWPLSSVGVIGNSLRLRRTAL